MLIDKGTIADRGAAKLTFVVKDCCRCGTAQTVSGPGAIDIRGIVSAQLFCEKMCGGPVETCGIPQSPG